METTGFVTLEAAALALSGADGRLSLATISRWRDGGAVIKNDVVARHCRAMLKHPQFLDEVRQEVIAALRERKRTLRIVTEADDPCIDVDEE